MPRTNRMALRKDALVTATIGEIGRKGSLDVTVSQIAKAAGVSSALAHHYFGSKDDLFLAAMREILTVFGSETRRALSKAETPRARLSAIVEASFSAVNFRADVIATWLNFYVMAQTHPEASRLLRIYQRRLASNLVAALRPLTDHPHAAATATAAMIDGLYIQHALSTDIDPDARAAIATVERYFEQALR